MYPRSFSTYCVLGLGHRDGTLPLRSFLNGGGDTSADVHDLAGCVQGWSQAWFLVGTCNIVWSIREGFLEEVIPELGLRGRVEVCQVGGGSG